MSGYRYPWPASALTREEMALLYHARERSPGRVPITQLIAEAVRAQYGYLADPSFSSTQPRSPNDQSQNATVPSERLSPQAAAA